MVLEEKKAERRREDYVVVLYILQIYSIKEKSGRESLGELRRRFVFITIIILIYVKEFIETIAQETFKH
jgi:hypothetical protein